MHAEKGAGMHVGAQLRRFGVTGEGERALTVQSPYEPAGDQPQAIEKLAQGVRDGLRYQTLMGVTGSGKTFTMAKTIEALNKPTLIIEPNKTLAAQVASEMKDLFPDADITVAAIVGMNGEEMTSQPRMVLGVPATREGCHRYCPC